MPKTVGRRARKSHTSSDAVHDAPFAGRTARCEDGSLMSIAGSNPAPLLGRDVEVELLASLLDGIREGGGALVLYGEPGIGKSRLLGVAAASARERGFTVLSTAGVQSEAHLPFAGLHQLLRPVRAHAAALPASQRDALEAAFGVAGTVAPEQFRIAMAVLDLL